MYCVTFKTNAYPRSECLEEIIAAAGDNVAEQSKTVIIDIN